MKRSQNEVSHEETQRQIDVIQRMKTRLGDKTRTYYITTFGCQMNARDSEKLKGILENMGYIEADEEVKADFVIYNTCCVRENAELKVYGRIGYLKSIKKKRPDMMIAICGCMMQQESVIAKIKTSYKHVDLVFGTHNLYKLAELMETRLDSKHMVIDIWDSHGEIVEDLPSIRKHKFKASVNIMFGCNNFCTYCIVPYVRGRERSRLPEDIIDEVKALVDDGVKELMLLGQNVNSYGSNLEEPMSFARLLKSLAQIKGLERIRFMTPHPKDLSDELIEVMYEHKNICKYLHLPVQSGSTRLLEKMNRRYSKESYLALVEKIKQKMPEIVLSTDIIVGFPGETDEDFEDTLEVYEQVKYSTAFTFIYSKRTGTPAATMELQIDESVIKARFNELLKRVDHYGYEFQSRQVGKVLDVLIEEVNHQDTSLMSGRTEQNSLVHIEGDESLIGQIIPVKITSAKSYYLVGERV